LIQLSVFRYYDEDFDYSAEEELFEEWESEEEQVEDLNDKSYEPPKHIKVDIGSSDDDDPSASSVPKRKPGRPKGSRNRAKKEHKRSAGTNKGALVSGTSLPKSLYYCPYCQHYGATVQVHFSLFIVNNLFFAIYVPGDLYCPVAGVSVIVRRYCPVLGGKNAITVKSVSSGHPGDQKLVAV
jgi:hypothetical protein